MKNCPEETEQKYVYKRETKFYPHCPTQSVAQYNQLPSTIEVIGTHHAHVEYVIVSILHQIESAVCAISIRLDWDNIIMQINIEKYMS